jgi:hypothetical protein
MVIPTLNLRDRSKPSVRVLTSIASEAEAISVWRPIHAFLRLNEIRPRFKTERVQASTILHHCHDRLNEPVEGGPVTDMAWLQSWATATGTSVLFELQSAVQAAAEVLDRKAAYSLAVFSLYVALVSTALTLFFGWATFR